MMKHTKKSKVNVNQSYDHMMGDIQKPQDHPAYNMPDPAGVSMGGQANPPSASQEDMYDLQDSY